MKQFVSLNTYFSRNPEEPQRMQALDELAAQAQELERGYKWGMIANFTALYDACVLFSALLRDLLM
jgi:hypothetical protein